MPEYSADAPISELRKLIDQARASKELEANTAALATAEISSGRPSVRTVYIHVEQDSIMFFVNTKSGKGRQLEWNPQVALCFFWRYLQKQVTIEGKVEQVSDSVADALWAKRPRESKLASRVSEQHLRQGDKASLESRLAEEKKAHNFDRIERPEHWMGYRLLPDRMEFWDTGWYRMRLRHLFERELDGRWVTLSQEP